MFVIKFFYKIILILFQLSILVVKCTEYKSRTFAGDEVDIRKVPYTVHISTGCTGALIRTQWILTAAHCFEGRDLKTAAVALRTTNSRISHYNIKIAKVYVHKEYAGKKKMSAHHDIALAKLAHSAVLSEEVQLLELETKSWPMDSVKKCTIAGYGQNIYHDSLLRISELSFSHGCACVKDWEIICTETVENGADSPCYGDSGGAVVCDNRGVSVMSTFIEPAYCTGIRPDRPSYGCATKDIFHLSTYIRPHLNWINNIIQNDGDLQNKAHILRVKSIQYYDIITNLQLFALLIIFSSYFY